MDKASYSCMYLVTKEIYEKLLSCIDERDKLKIAELNKKDVGNENGAFPDLPPNPPSNEGDDSFNIFSNDDGNDGDDGNGGLDGNDGDDNYNDDDLNDNDDHSEGQSSTASSSSSSIAPGLKRHLKKVSNLHLADFSSDSDSNKNEREKQISNKKFGSLRRISDKNISYVRRRNRDRNISNSKKYSKIQTSENNNPDQLVPLPQNYVSIRHDITGLPEVEPAHYVIPPKTVVLSEKQHKKLLGNIKSKTSFRCSVCNSLFKSSNLLTKHSMKCSLGNIKKSFFPGMSKNEDSDILQDKNISSSVQPESYICDICNAVFKTLRLLKIHSTEKHKKTNKLEGIKKKKELFKKFEYPKWTLLKRKKQLSNIENDYSMGGSDNETQDGKYFSANESSDDAMSDKKSMSDSLDDIAALECMLCSQTFSTYVALKRHIKNIHNADESYVSKDNKGEKRKVSDSNGNIKNYGPRKTKKFARLFYRCQLCDYTFSEEKSLNRHLKNAHSCSPNYISDFKQGVKRKRADTPVKKSVKKEKKYDNWN